ncbi:kinase-like partial [Lentinula edodes]|uniref:Kinase-like partial n=1 Tax=Lentinula edodes TaxID=5353 RepID=A0A1Q3EHG8_LENED|nr:kinase-like partial [Lentinula edodes]
MTARPHSNLVVVEVSFDLSSTAQIHCPDEFFKEIASLKRLTIELEHTRMQREVENAQRIDQEYFAAYKNGILPRNFFYRQKITGSKYLKCFFKTDLDVIGVSDAFIDRRVPPYVATSNTGRVYAAQDSLGRHVYIKILKKDSEQLRVVELLRRQKETPGVLPIVDVLEYDEEYAFLVMPRWADIPGPSNLLRSVKDVGEFVVDILKGLDTLHSLRIAHRDIKMNNMVMNHLFPLPVRALRPLQHLDIHSSPGGTFKIITDSREAVFHRLEFAIIDFDFSMIIPGNKNGKDRLPSTLAWMQEYSALDVSQGELVYDPFKYDVGVLGVMFCEMLQKFTPMIPHLAPLLDRMTTHELAKRFTARQAHAFAETYLLRELNEKQLQQCLTVSSHQLPSFLNSFDHTRLFNSPWTSYDRWANLPPSFFLEFPQWSELKKGEGE